MKKSTRQIATASMMGCVLGLFALLLVHQIMMPGI